MIRPFRLACMTLCAAAFFTSAAVSAFPEYDPGKEQILVYTREADPGSYPDGLARSVHFARSIDGKNFTAMNENYGILFAKGTLSEQNTIRPKCVKNPVIFPMKDGGYGIMAVRTNENGTPDEESKGKALLWTTKDLIHFTDEALFDLNTQEEVVAFLSVSPTSDGSSYRIFWKTASGRFFCTDTPDFKSPGKTDGPIMFRLAPKPEINAPEGMVPNNDTGYSTVSVPET